MGKHMQQLRQAQDQLTKEHSRNINRFLGDSGSTIVLFPFSGDYRLSEKNLKRNFELVQSSARDDSRML